MKRFSHLAGLAGAALLLGGCVDTLFRTRYQVLPSASSAPPAAQTPGSAEDDRRAIRETLAGIATGLGYLETDELKVPDMLASYRQNIRYFPIRLIAREEGRAAVVSVFLFTGGLGWARAREYARVRDRVEADLRARFGNRVKRMPRGE